MARLLHCMGYMMSLKKPIGMNNLNDHGLFDEELEEILHPRYEHITYTLGHWARYWTPGASCLNVAERRDYRPNTQHCNAWLWLAMFDWYVGGVLRLPPGVEEKR